MLGDGTKRITRQLETSGCFRVPRGAYRIVDVHSTVPARIMMHSRHDFYDDGFGSGESTCLVYDSRYGIIPTQTPIREGDMLYLSAIS